MGPLLSNELPVPAKDGVGSDERSNFAESPSSNGLATNCEPPTLIVGQPESSASKLLLQDAVLLAEILDGRILLATNPASHGGNEDLPRLEQRRHPEIVAKPKVNRQLSN
jgi:hypothetical protein